MSEIEDTLESPAELLEEVIRRLNDRELAIKLSLAFHKHGLARFPDEPDFLHDLARAAERRQDWSQAEKYWRAFISKDDRPAWAHTALAATLRQQDRPDEALAVLHAGAVRFPDDPGFLHDLARAAEHRRDWPQAEHYWREFITKDDRPAWAHIALAATLREQGRLDEAETALIAAQARLPHEVALFIDYARLAELRGERGEVLSRWENVRARFPDVWIGYCGNAAALRELGRLDEAHAVLTEGAARFPDETGLLHDLARAAEQRRDWPQAEHWWREFIIRDDRPGWAHTALAATLREQGRLDDAEAVLTAAQARLPHDVTVFADHARLAEIKGRWDAALSRWETVRARFPDVWIGYCGNAAALRALGRGDAAQALLEEGAARFPGEPALLHDLARAAEHRRDWTQAEHYWREFIARDDRPLWAHTALVAALREQGRGDEAHRMLIATAERFPSQPDLWADLARAAEQRRDWPAAERFWRQFLARDERPSWAHRGLAVALDAQGKYDEADAAIEAAMTRPPVDVATFAQAARIALRRCEWDQAVARWEDVQRRFPDARFVAHRLFEARRWAAQARALVGDAPETLRQRTELARVARLSLGERLVTGGVPPERIVQPTWSAERMDLMRKWSEESPDGSPAQVYAAVQIDCMAGEHERARARLGRAIDICDDRYPTDADAMRKLVLAAVLASQWDVAIRLLRDRYLIDWVAGLDVRRDDAYSRESVLWEIDRAGMSRFYFDASVFDYSGSLDRWAESIDLFFTYTMSPAKEMGRVIFPLGDGGSGPGLAPSDNRRDYFLIPDAHFLRSEGYASHRQLPPTPWSERKPAAIWRGGAFWLIDKYPSSLEEWLETPRIKLCRIAREPGSEDCLDAGLYGGAVVPELEQLGLRSDFVPRQEFLKYKYQIDIDGITNAWEALFTKLLSGNTVLKVASALGFRQWYYDDLVPWTHFVPVAVDMGDLVEKIRWLRAHDDVARRIGEQGRELALRLTFAGEMWRACATINRAMRYFAGRPEVVIPFDRDLPERCYLGEGWSDLRGGGHAPLRPEACVAFPRPAGGGDLELQISLAQAEPGPLRPFRMEIIVNDVKVAQTLVAQPGTVTASVPDELLSPYPQTAVKIRFPDSTTTVGEAMPNIVVTRLQLAHCAVATADLAPA